MLARKYFWDRGQLVIAWSQACLDIGPQIDSGHGLWISLHQRSSVKEGNDDKKERA